MNLGRCYIYKKVRTAGGLYEMQRMPVIEADPNIGYIKTLDDFDKQIEKLFEKEPKND